jgi:YHS domain-containing protein
MPPAHAGHIDVVAPAPQGQPAGGRRTLPIAPTVAIDPICGMTVETAGARHTAEVDGTTYYFCCAQCRATFLKEPQRYRAARP